MDATPFRRVGARLEIHARRAPAGRTPHVVDGTDLLVLVGADAARLRCCGRARALPPDFLAVLDTGEVLVLELPDTTECRTFHLAPGLLQEVARSVPVLPDVLASGRRVVWVMAGPSLCDLADGVGSEDGVARLIEQVIATNGARCRLAPEEHVDHAVVSRVRDILRDDFARKVTLTELGTLVGMRRSALVRAFTREVGMPPHAYRTHVRVLRARELIAAGHPLSDVSLEVGFNDQSHLNRHFKRLMGITPGMYARAASMPTPTLQSPPPPWVARTSGDPAANNLQASDSRRLHLQGEATQPRFSGSDTTHIVVNPPR